MRSGTSSALPERATTNDDLANELSLRHIETSDEWIRTRTGIEKRYLAEKGLTVTQLAERAARAALWDSGLAPEDIDLIIVATTTPDGVFPSMACRLQAALGISGCAAFDVQAVCAGYVYAMSVADGLVRTGAYRRALVVGADTLSRVMDFTDRTTCVLFGDGAGAAVLECREDYPQLYAVWGSRGDDASLYAPGVGCDEPSYLHMDGRAVFRFATEVMPRATKEVLDAAGITADEVDRFVYHQANKRIVDYSVKKLGLDPAKCEGNIDHMGNTSAGSVPILLDELVRAGKIVPGNRVLMAGFGAGLTWAGALAELA